MEVNNQETQQESKNENNTLDIPKCGIIMPISEIDGCSSEHWEDVLHILKEIIESIDFEANLVSDSDDIGVIQKRIVQNIYNNPIIVCDVSGKNPNVMFELGLRLAFDKPTIIIKDDKTSFSFDTSVIEHITYPRDLRFNKMVEFKKELGRKIKATYSKSKSDPNYSTFLKNFGEFKVAKLHQHVVSSDQYILESIGELKSEIKRLRIDGNDRINSSRKRGLANEHEQESIIKNAIIDYMIKTNIKTTASLKKNEQELYTYLIDRKEMPDYFNSPSEVEVIANNIISKM